MDLYPQGVAEAMGEIFSISRRLEDRPGRRVDLSAGDPRPGRGDTRPLGLQNGAVDTITSGRVQGAIVICYVGKAI